MRFFETCIKALNNSRYFKSIKSTSDIRNLSKKRCEDFLRNLATEAMNADLVKDRSISDLLQAQIPIDIIAKKITSRYQDEENLMSKWVSKSFK